MTNDQPATWKRDLLWLFAAILLFFSIGLGARPYLTPSEARYIEVPRQMLVTHDWLTPRINGVPYFEKPPLFYWMQVSVMQWFGTGEFAGRIATALLSTLTCLVTYATGRMLYGRLAGLMATGVLTTCILGYILSRVSMVDMPVSLFLTCCFACFLASQHYELRSAASPPGAVPAAPLNGARRYAPRRFYWLMYVAAALAVMSKGLIGIVIPGLVIAPWIALTKRWRVLLEAQLIPGLIIVLAIAAPWHWLMMQNHPDFFDFYFINEHFTRYLTDSHKRVQPWWFFAVITLAGLLPWTGLLPSAWKRLNRKDPVTLFLAVWIVLPFLFFSASHSKLAPYIFPIFPALAVILGRYLSECWQDEVPLKALRKNTIFVTVLFGSVLLAYPFLSTFADDDMKLAFNAMPLLLLLPVAVALIGLAYTLITKRSARVLITMLAAFAVTLDITANYAVANIDHATVKPLVAQLLPRLREGDMVVAYGSYFQDLPIYLNRNVTVAGYTGEMDFGVTHYKDTQNWMIDDEEFWKRCASAKQPVYVFMKKTTYSSLPAHDNCRLKVMAEYGKTVMLEKERP